MDFRDITPQFISGYTAYLQSLPNQRTADSTLSPNSIAKHLKILRAILNRAVDDRLIQPYDIPRKLITVRETRLSPLAGPLSGRKRISGQNSASLRG